MKRIFLTCLVGLLICLLSPSQIAEAHVFFTDETGKYGVVLHVLPDDDPIAGSETQMFFDVQGENLSTRSHDFVLHIANSKTPNDKSQAVVRPTGDQTVSASYVFPSQGTFILKLTVYQKSDTKTETAIFSYSQNVSRGVVGSPLDQPRYGWAEFGLVAAMASTFVVIVTFISRRERILGYTKWK